MADGKLDPKDYDLPDVPVRDFGLINDRLSQLIAAVGNRIDREWPKTGPKATPEGRVLVLSIYRTAQNYLAASRFLLADREPGDARRPEFVQAVSPLSRVLMEALCMIVFLFGDFKKRVDWHYKSGWLDVKRELDRITEAYADDPDWADAIRGRRSFLEKTREMSGLTDDDLTTPKKWQFPNPDAMLRGPLKGGSQRYEFVQYFVLWYYREFSQDAHLSFTGLARNYSSLVISREVPEAVSAHFLATRRFEQFSKSLVLMMCIITELELELRFGEKERAKYIWAILNDWTPLASEVYARFYERYLGPATTANLKRT